MPRSLPVRHTSFTFPIYHASVPTVLRLPGHHLLRWKHILQFHSLEIQDRTVTSSSENGEEKRTRMHLAVKTVVAIMYIAPRTVFN